MKISEETREKMSKSHIGKTLGYKHTEETKVRMRANHADVSGSNNPNYRGSIGYDTGN
jgi:hypothetical protein